MRRRPPRSTRTDTIFPYTTLFRSPQHPTEPCPPPDARLRKNVTPNAVRDLHAAAAMARRRSSATCDPRHRGSDDSHRKQSTRNLPCLRRSEERRVGKECVSTCRSRCSQSHYTKKYNYTYANK